MHIGKIFVWHAIYLSDFRHVDDVYVFEANRKKIDCQLLGIN